MSCLLKKITQLTIDLGQCEVAGDLVGAQDQKKNTL